MNKFSWIEDVDDWLEAMNYEEFWRAVRPHCLVMPSREMCDADIADGAAFEDVFEGIKAIARHELIKRHRLERKPIGPVLRVISE